MYMASYIRIHHLTCLEFASSFGIGSQNVLYLEASYWGKRSPAVAVWFAAPLLRGPFGHQIIFIPAEALIRAEQNEFTVIMSLARKNGARYKRSNRRAVSQ